MKKIAYSIFILSLLSKAQAAQGGIDNAACEIPDEYNKSIGLYCEEADGAIANIDDDSHIEEREDANNSSLFEAFNSFHNGQSYYCDDSVKNLPYVSQFTSLEASLPSEKNVKQLSKQVLTFNNAKTTAKITARVVKNTAKVAWGTAKASWALTKFTAKASWKLGKVSWGLSKASWGLTKASWVVAKFTANASLWTLKTAFKATKGTCGLFTCKKKKKKKKKKRPFRRVGRRPTKLDRALSPLRTTRDSYPSCGSSSTMMSLC